MNDVCSIELLTNAVANRLSADEEAALCEHLEQCDACCARMEQLAGGQQWQQEAASLLTTDELDAAIPETMVWSEIDFSVEHLEPSEDANLLGQLGGYDVLAIIGRGGMGVVLKAFDRELKRLVAIKALSPHLAHSSVARKRFAREAQAAAAVVNPHVIAIHHVQPTGRLPFLIMPLLTGETLAQRLKSRAPLELTEVLRIGMQAAVGLAAAHDQGLVHRDVKPANIFLEKGVERVVITDFGLARAADDVSMTRQGVVAGTPEYMSPEQARGEALDGRSDLFSLGCVLYEMATGVSPFRTDSTIATLRKIVDDKPAAIASLAPELPPWFSHIVERLLSKDPAQRFTSASEVSQLLEACLSHLQQPTSVPLPAYLLPHASGRRWNFNSTRIGVLTMLGTIGTALLAMVIWQVTEAPDISGNWTSEEWGTVVLEGKGRGQYEGTFTGKSGAEKSNAQQSPERVKIGGEIADVDLSHSNNEGVLDKAKSGTFRLKWSRVELRFNGTWSSTVNRIQYSATPEGLIINTPVADVESGGKISIRLLDNQIRGVLTTSKGHEKQADSPRRGDLLWTRSRETTSPSNVQDGNSTLTEPPLGDENKLLVRRSESSVKVEGQFNGNEEVLLVIGDPKTPTERKGKKEVHWPVSLEKAGEYTFEVRRDILKLDGGGTAPGLVFQVQGLQNPSNDTTSNITVLGKYLQPDGKVVLASTKDKLLLARKTDPMLVVVGKVEYPDASTLAVHILIRSKAGVNSTTRVVEPVDGLPHRDAPQLQDRIDRTTGNITANIAIESTVVPQPRISNVTIAAQTASISGIGGANQECVLRIAESKKNKQLEWTTPAPGPFTATITATDHLPSGTGKPLKGIVLTVQNAMVFNTSNIAMTDDDPVPAGVVRFREPSAMDRSDTMMTFADIHCDDGTKIPISMLVRVIEAPRNVPLTVTGKQVGTVLGKPIYEGDINKNTSTRDNLIRLLLQPLTEDYCRKNGLGRSDELNAKVKDEKSRKMVSWFVFTWELNRHLYEKHGGRVELTPFGSVAFDGMRKWLDEREHAGDYEITDPQLKTALSELYQQVPPGTMFAKPDQLETAFDPANIDRFIEEYAKIPAGAYSNPAKKLVGTVFEQPIYLHERYFADKAELPGLLYNLIVPRLEESYMKQHPEIEPTDAEKNELAARMNAGSVESEQQKSVESMFQTLKLQKHIYENYGGGRALIGGRHRLLLVDAKKRWLEEREKLGEFQISSDDIRKTLDSFWTIESHPGSKLVDEAKVHEIFDYNFQGGLSTQSNRGKGSSNVVDNSTKTITLPKVVVNESSRKFPFEKVASHIASIKQQTGVTEAVDELRKITGLDFGNGVDRESRQAWLKWWEHERSCISAAKDEVRQFVLIGVITANGKPLSGANVLANVPFQSSPSGQYQLGITHADKNGRYVLALGVPPFTKPEEPTLAVTFTARLPRFVADQEPVVKILHVDTVQREAPVERNDDDIFAGSPHEINFNLK